MKIAPETQTEIEREAAPVARAHARTEPIIALARSVLRQRLPAWAMVTLLGIAMVCYTANRLIAPLLETEVVTTTELESRLAEETCPRDLALLLRWMVSSKLVDGEAMTADLKLCMLLRERQEREDP